MKLLTKALEKKLPAIYAQDGKGDNAKAYVKFFAPWTNWTWYVTEYDPETGDCFGLVEGLERELGYFNLHELQAIKGPLGLKIERDTWFETTTLGEIKK
jgi:hypothetical protein